MHRRTSPPLTAVVEQGVAAVIRKALDLAATPPQQRARTDAPPVEPEAVGCLGENIV